MHARTIAAALALVALTIPKSASADVVSPPPDACPPGSLPSTGHMGPHCAATECDSTLDCESMPHGPWSSETRRFECAPAGLCLRPMTVHAGHGRRFEMRAVLGSCASDSDCADPRASCVMTSRCIAQGSRDGPVTSDAIPRELPHWAPSSGCTSAIVVIVILAGAAWLVARGGADARGERARDRLIERGRATHAELAALAPDVSAALAPIAERVRVEVDEGETVYVVESEGSAREASRGA